MADQSVTLLRRTRKEAKALGLARYFPGDPCAAGHMSEWTTANGTCIACSRERARTRRGSDLSRIARMEAARSCAPADPGRPTVSRSQAKSEGKGRYFTGIPCINGHISERLTRGKMCLECHRLRGAAVRKTDPERIRSQKADSYARNRESVIAKAIAYTAANRETVRDRQKRFRKANKEAIAERMKVWSKANRPILRQHERNRRARERGAEGAHTVADIQAIGVAQRWRCASPACRCAVRKAYHVDHIQPLALGGTNDRRNLQLLCAPCNQAKHARHPIEWAQSLGLLL